ncbi:RNA-binding domain-containing protein [Thermophagus xiamenensis]|uniref:Predicted transcriptional regulator, contains HTH domain n=1 Tax=Thermophagus xiamenensis TaxID=385682 RepID=A0A1I2EUS4_9BACT|nr:RNA-binding domain-containing protein [Thermophagus xiamenensis]SFE96198.1 Predicted transcriptional regulator, contains HTH domain [Thermophagus xiamenensis]
MKLKDLLSQPEGRRIEFKEQLPSKADLCKTVVAFANDAGGELYIGIKDNPRIITGLDENDLLKIEEQIINIIHDGCAPVILPEISFRRYQNKPVIVVKIFKGNNPPYYLKSKGIEKGTYIRIGSSSRLANREIIEELQRQSNNISFDALPIYNKEVKNLKWNDFKNQLKEIIGEKVNLTHLAKLNLIVNEQNRKFPNNALILLSSDDLKTQLFPNAKIECARFKGTVPGDFIDQKTIDVPLSFQAEEAYRFVLRHISKGSEYEGVFRKDRWEYPVVAIRELIRNAVIHRDYALKGMDIKIAIFDDKIEISSPGKLLPSIDFNDMEAGQSDIRNRTLAPVFKLLGIIEQWGNGLRLIHEELKRYPEIDFLWNEHGMMFRVSLIKKNFNAVPNSQSISDHYHQTPSDTVEYRRNTVGIPSEYRRILADCSEQEKTIILYILKNNKITSKSVENLINIKESRARELLRLMVSKNFIERHGKGKNTYYTLKA